MTGAHRPRPTRRRYRMGWPDLESFLIGAIVGAIVPIIALLYLTWKGLVQW